MAGYPGNKAGRYVPGIHARTIVDLFMGGGGWTKAARRNNPDAVIVGAEASPLQRANLQGVYREMAVETANVVRTYLQWAIDKRWDGTGCYGEKFPRGRQLLGLVWDEYVKDPYDEGMMGNVDADALAASLCVSSYGFGTNVRISSNGLNTPPNAQKIRASKTVTPFDHFPDAHIAEDFREVEFSRDGAIALIDPPYWLPPRMRKTHKLLTSCYPGHQPYGDATRQLYIDALEIATGSDVIIVAGYWSEELDQLIQADGYRKTAIRMGELVKQDTRHRLKHGKRAQDKSLPKPVDFEWWLVRDGVSVDIPVQLSLF